MDQPDDDAPAGSVEGAAMSQGKAIPIEQVRLGMYIVGLDRSWFHTPFFKHRWLLQREEDLARLKAYGISQVMIDPSRGLDVEPAVAPVRPTRSVDATPQPPQHTEAFQARFEQEVAQARALRADARSAIERIFTDLKTGAPLDSQGLRTVVTAVLDRLTDYPVAMLTLTQLEQMKRLDTDLFAHAVDVCIFSLIVGRAHGLTDGSLEQLGLGALLHDIGETRLPQNLLHKPGRHTEQDLALLRLHPRIGLAVLSGTGPLPAITRAVIAEHHERMDGSGYPDGLRGSRISLPGQIVGLVDAYDAMASRRKGRPPLSPGQAVRQLFQLGLKHQYDRTLVEWLIQCLGVYPFGSLVELSTGERAVVYAVNQKERLKPCVKLITDAQGRPYAQPKLIDLAEARPDEPARAILRVLDAEVEQVDVRHYCEASTRMPLTAGAWH